LAAGLSYVLAVRAIRGFIPPMKGLLLCLLAAVTIARADEAPAKKKIPASRVVLVHGIFQNEWRCFGFLRRELEAHGVECVSPSLKPADGRAGIPAMAEQLKREVDARFGPRERFVLVGFSMGGLISRHYLQELGGAKRCDAFFTISTPHHGTVMANMWYGEGARQMRPGSPWLANLAATENRLGKIPIVSYRTCADLVIIPSSSSLWDRAENLTIPCPLHPLMTSSPRVRADILGRLALPR